MHRLEFPIPGFIGQQYPDDFYRDGREKKEEQCQQVAHRRTRKRHRHTSSSLSTGPHDKSIRTAARKRFRPVQLDSRLEMSRDVFTQMERAQIVPGSEDANGHWGDAVARTVRGETALVGYRGGEQRRGPVTPMGHPDYDARLPTHAAPGKNIVGRHTGAAQVCYKHVNASGPFHTDVTQDPGRSRLPRYTRSPQLSSQNVKSDHIINPEVVIRIVALDLVVPAVVVFSQDMGRSGGLFHDVFGLADERLALGLQARDRSARSALWKAGLCHLE